MQSNFEQLTNVFYERYLLSFTLFYPRVYLIRENFQKFKTCWFNKNPKENLDLTKVDEFTEKLSVFHSLLDQSFFNCSDSKCDCKRRERSKDTGSKAHTKFQQFCRF